MKVACLFSGGKDSVFAAFCTLFSGWDVTLVTIEPAEYSTMFHHPNIKWCKRQAEMMGLPITMVRARGKLEEDELNALKAALKKLKVDGIASGAIESEYQRERIEKIAHELKIRSFAPIWRTDGKLLDEQCRYLETYVTAVSAEGLGKDDLGKRYNEKFVEKLRKMKPKVSPNLEGGEGETFVANAPFFKKAIRIKSWEKKWDGQRGIAEIKGIER